ncbi:DUF1439 domain-containing protein [Marinomonas dokdonensis]|uniref:DUF1439 domain-containing protein n=1 Tax=Marinomonas dokdonensis TaxID=328224 RepID=UPI0040553E75
MSFPRFGFLLAVLVSSLAISGCNSFRISETELNEEVAKQLANPQTNQIEVLLDGHTLNLELLVKSASIDLTDRDGGLVMVDMVSDMKGRLKAFGQEFEITTQLLPSFESGVRIEEDRLYLVAPKVTNIQVQGASFSENMLRSVLGSLHGDFEKALAQYFDQHPVYVLDHSPFEKTAASMVKDIIVTEDSLEFSLF